MSSSARLPTLRLVGDACTAEIDATCGRPCSRRFVSCGLRCFFSDLSPLLWASLLAPLSASSLTHPLCSWPLCLLPSSASSLTCLLCTGVHFCRFGKT